MEKIAKQIVVNLVIVLLSVLVIFLAKTFPKGHLLEWKEYLSADIVFVMITSLGTMVGWRFSENIKGHWLYNMGIAVVIFLLTLVYGAAIPETVSDNDVLVYSIVISFIAFVLCYFIENCIIIYYFSKQPKKEDKVGYKVSYQSEN